MNVLKESLSHLKPYATLKRNKGIKLDSNEGENYLLPEGITLDLPFERYPENHADALKEAIAKVHHVDPSQLLTGNGSSEILEWVIKSVIGKGETILTVDPTFVMYKFYATIHECDYVSVPLSDDFSFPLDAFLSALEKTKPKLIILCSPNNPTGGLIDPDVIRTILEKAPGLVVLDEAYIEFAQEQPTFIHEVESYPNLLVTRTFSKAYGLASIRLGYAVGSKALIEQLKLTKTPYNVNALSQTIGQKVIHQQAKVSDYVTRVIKRRDSLKKELERYGYHVFESAANFVFMREPFDGFTALIREKGILIRPFTLNENYVRISIGSESDINAFKKALKEINDDL